MFKNHNGNFYRIKTSRKFSQTPKISKSLRKKNENVKFVQKLKANHGVSLKKVKEVNFTATGDLETEFFAQIFVENPLLISGHKFAKTSVNSLRVYYYNKNVHFRFCRLPYDSENFDKIDSYVIGETHMMDNVIYNFLNLVGVGS